MPSSVACRSLRTLLMDGFECLPVRCSASAPAPAPFLPHRLLRLCVHLCSAKPRRPVSKNLPFRQKSSGFCSYSYRPHVPRNAGALPAVHPTVDKRIDYLKSKLEEQGIRCGSGKPGKYWRNLCPKCQGGSSKERLLSFSISDDGWLANWMCFRAPCGWRGSVRAFEECKIGYAKTIQTLKLNDYRVITEIDLQLEPLCTELIAYFAERSISAKTLERNGIMQCKQDDQIVIAFTYRRNAALVSCKYLASSKECWQETGTEHIFYGLDDIKQASDVIIVDGEIDKLSMEEAGFPNCISVPYGLPAQSSKELHSEDEATKFQYLWNCKEYLEKASRIILATDAGGPGQALADELARRLGKERCWRVKWPKKNAIELCKDANEVLMYIGPDKLRDVIENAELCPIMGLSHFSNFFNEVDEYYHRSLGFERVSTGWRALDELYNVVPGELTVITGVPNSGKSEWIDALLCNINEARKWKFLLCSMENKVRDHARKLLEKYINKPFINSRYGESTERMSVQELEQGKKWLNDTFYLIRCEDDSLPSIDWVLELAKSAVVRYGIRGLVIDPYNELDHQRSSKLTETQYVSHMLTKIKRFAHHHSCHVWFVAHPRQLQNWRGYPPNLYDISGSAHFINKCDNGIVIHRNRNANAGPLDRVQVCVRKVRNKVAGRIGDAFLSYNKTTGKFEDWHDGARTFRKQRR
ncbi:twinkle homolog protein, chloroplastic/mitochondrial-like isoform X1 [Musa acuminata AAA Group]|uniref:twinkle homolog protein, chloroplastic/mitochondrial-like isoform X1 n=1 Tax=Musa acuminata AAA Group TaxID=214697 RepID=UPI0031DC0463